IISRRPTIIENHIDGILPIPPNIDLGYYGSVRSICQASWASTGHFWHSAAKRDIVHHNQKAGGIC
ncbi:MAG: hypothetical protein ACE5H6_04140, partial [Dehalococcoidia bacterium]